MGAHVLLAAGMEASPVIATTHALLTCLLAFWAVLRWNSIRIVQVAAYIAGADVLWRMTAAHVPWEVAKYLVTALCLGGILRLGRRAQWRALPLIYFGALLPSIAVLLEQYRGTLEDVRQMISFNLSGPLSLFASVWYISQLRLTRRDTRQVLTALIAPLLAIATITLLRTYTATDLTFTDNSNFATSGGFGPNQVSVVLGLGALVSVLTAIDSTLSSPRRWFVFCLAMFFAIQCVMTFSRGGLYSFGFAFLPGSVVLMAESALAKMALSLHRICHRNWHDGRFPPTRKFYRRSFLAARFRDTDPTHRDEIVHEDIRIWERTPTIGGGTRECSVRAEGLVSYRSHGVHSTLVGARYPWCDSACSSCHNFFHPTGSPPAHVGAGS